MGGLVGGIDMLGAGPDGCDRVAVVPVVCRVVVVTVSG